MKKDAIKILLEVVSEKDIEILQMRKREIEILENLIEREETISNLIKVIADLKFPAQKEMNPNG
jgi:hypothetical protein